MEEHGWREQLKIKESTSAEDLCQGLPRCFLNFLRYSKSLKFEDKPDYKLLRSFFEDYFQEQKFLRFETDLKLDWVTRREAILEEKKKREEEEEKELELKKKMGKMKHSNKRELAM